VTGLPRQPDGCTTGFCSAIIGLVEVTFAQSARRHKVGKERARHVVRHPYIVIRQPAPPGSPLADDRLVFLGDDQTGRALEVVAIETRTGLHVIHVMDLRAKWRPYYEKGRDS
jgi:hypothetical protein